MPDLNLFCNDLIPATLDEILYGKLRPEKRSFECVVFYNRHLHCLKEETTDFRFQFDFNFPLPFNEKTEFYHCLICNQVKREVPRIIRLIKEDKNEFHARQRLNWLLKDYLEPNLIKVGQDIWDKGYTRKYLKPKPKRIRLHPELSSNAYSIRLAGRALAKIYLEVQDAFSEWISRKLSPESLYAKFIKEACKRAPIHRISIPSDGSNVLNGQEARVRDRKPAERVSTDSFTCPAYSRNPKKLEDAWNSLRNSGMIGPETSRAAFERVFSGKPVETPVRWTGFISDLYYFVYLAHTKNKVVSQLKKDIWVVTCKCFVDKDGKPFKRGAFRQLHASTANKECIEKAVEHFLK